MSLYPCPTATAAHARAHTHIYIYIFIVSISSHGRNLSWVATQQQNDLFTPFILFYVHQCLHPRDPIIHTPLTFFFFFWENSIILYNKKTVSLHISLHTLIKIGIWILSISLWNGECLVKGWDLTKINLRPEICHII